MPTVSTPSAPLAAVRRYLDVPEARQLHGLLLGHMVALAAAEGRSLDPVAAAHELAAELNADPAAADLVANTALCAYKALLSQPRGGFACKHAQTHT